ncbi:MAG: pyridoxal phosphate-dependent aminotransferase [Eubacteriales bacterium]|jgi:aspartate aminotransferase
MCKPLSIKASAVQPSATLSIDSKFKQMKADGMDVVGFGAGEPDFDTPQHIKDAAVEALNKGFTKYTPASGMLELKKAICEKFERDNGLHYEPNQIVVSNGAKHSLFNALNALCNTGDEVIIPSPFWVSYTEMIYMADAIPVPIETTEAAEFKITPLQLQEAITPRTKVLMLNSPCNPTGMIYSEKELRAIADICVENDIYVISDEIYEKLIYDGQSHVSIASFNDRIKDLTIVINGVSKSYAMTGWRIGYSASNPRIARVMSNFQSHAASNPNSIAQYATIAALRGPQDEVEKMRVAFGKRRDYMVERMNSIDKVHCIKPHGAFYVMMNLSKLIGTKLYGHTIHNADDFCQLFLDKAGVALVPGTSFHAPHHCRWSYATSRKNIEEGLTRLEKFLNEEY